MGLTICAETSASRVQVASAETARKLRDGWYFTGDLGFLHAGELYVTGRKHDLIIVHGRNYYAHELEFLINQLPGVHPGRNVALGWFRPEVGTEEVVVIAEAAANGTRDTHAYSQVVRRTVGRWVNTKHRRRPMIVPVVIEA